MKPLDGVLASDQSIIAGYRVHPVAMLLPEPSPEEYERIKADIREHGLRDQIVMTLDDQILDGRTRAKILDELGIEIRTESIIEKGRLKVYRTARYLDGGEDDDPIAYVLSANAARRHLTGDQIIALYLDANKAKIEADQQAAKIAQQAGLKKGSTQPVGATVNPTGKVAAKIAKALGKSESAVKRVQRAKKVAPEKMADVAAGKVSAMEVLKEVAPSESATKVKKKSKGTKSDEHGSRGTDSLGRRIPKKPLPERMEYTLGTSLPIGIDCLARFLLEARQAEHGDFPQWIQQARDLHARFGTTIALVEQEPAPTLDELQALLDPDQQDEAADNPLATHEKVIDVSCEVRSRPKEDAPVKHEAVPGVGTFSCACGNRYSTQRGLHAHVMKAQYWMPVAELRDLADRAGYTMRLDLPEGWPTDPLQWATHVPDT